MGRYSGGAREIDVTGPFQMMVFEDMIASALRWLGLGLGLYLGLRPEPQPYP